MRLPTIDDEIAIGRMLSAIEDGVFDEAELAKLRKQWNLAGRRQGPGHRHHRHRRRRQVLVTDELLNRFLPASRRCASR
jgi:isobutyryl-CoA mutase